MQRISFEAYLALEEKAQRKHELVDGVLYAMAGSSRAHNRITTNLVGLLWLHAKDDSCQVYASDMRLRCDEQTSYYPDVMVVCTQDSKEYYQEHPCVVVEVLSKSTEAVDRREKLIKYLNIASLQAYILVDSLARRVEGYYRSDDGWKYLDVMGEGTVPIPCLETTLSLADIYRGLSLPATRLSEEE